MIPQTRQPKTLYGRPQARPAAMTTLSSMPAGPGAVGTAQNPSPAAPNNAPSTAMTRVQPMQSRPNSGGNITTSSGRGLGVPSDPGYRADQQDSGPQSGGTMRRGGLTRVVPASPGPNVVVGQPANRPAQTERANPLDNGGGAPQMAGTTMPVAPAPTPPAIDPGKAMGASSRGNRVPAGQDQPSAAAQPAAPAAADTPEPGAETSPTDDLADVTKSVQSDLSAKTHVGGFGQYARNFSSPTAASIYDDHVRQLFGRGAPKPADTTTQDPDQAV